MVGLPMAVSKLSTDGVDESESDDIDVLVADLEVAEVLVAEDSESESGNMAVPSPSSMTLNSSRRCWLKASLSDMCGVARSCEVQGADSCFLLFCL